MSNFVGSDRENHEYTAKLNADRQARINAIKEALDVASDGGKLVTIKMHHGAIINTNVQSAFIALERRDAVAMVKADGSLQEF